MVAHCTNMEKHARICARNAARKQQMLDVERASGRECRDALEEMVSRFGLTCVINMLAEVCTEKARFAREAMHDGRVAQYWNEDARRLGNIALND